MTADTNLIQMYSYTRYYSGNRSSANVSSPHSSSVLLTPELTVFLTCSGPKSCLKFLSGATGAGFEIDALG